MPRQTVTALDYSTDAEPGLTRIARDGDFAYRGRNGSIIRNAKTLARIAALVIPPAWTDVWICANPRGHIQVTGKDVRGRKQYRYHAQWTAERDSNKFDSLREFARVLPGIRRHTRRDLALPSLSKARVLAAVVQLMDRSFIRVGGERYRRENGSFGLTTLRNRHVKCDGDEISLDFRGKSGKRHQMAIQDSRVASVVRRCLDLPGTVLFQYREGSDVRTISAADVNEYLREVAGSAVTSKDFRTWGGTVHAAQHLEKVGRPETITARRAIVREAIKAASRVLGNTPAVCKRSYIHPVVFAAYEAGAVAAPAAAAGLRSAERSVLGLLKAGDRTRKARSPRETQVAPEGRSRRTISPARVGA